MNDVLDKLNQQVGHFINKKATQGSKQKVNSITIASIKSALETTRRTLRQRGLMR
jgi:hypothetical protein